MLREKGFGILIVLSVLTMGVQIWAESPYSVTHDFRIKSKYEDASLMSVTWEHFEHAWAIQSGCTPNADWCPDNDPEQFPAFDEYGREVISSGYIMQSPNSLSPVPGNPPGFTLVKTKIETITGACTKTSEVTANSGTTSAWACSSLTIDPYDPDTGFLGNISSDGYTTLGGEDSAAWSFTSSKLRVLGAASMWEETELGWNPTLATTVSGSNWAKEGNPIFKDPVNILVRNDDDVVVHEETILTIDGYVDFGSVDAGFTWEAGYLSMIDIIDGELIITVDSPNIPEEQCGLARLIIEDSLIVESTDSGIFDGLLPLVGQSSTFTVPFLDEIVLDYTMPEIADAASIEFILSGGGSVPEPAFMGILILNGLGLLTQRRRRKS